MARRQLALVAAASAAVFCSAGASATSTGLRGIVTRGPTAPVCRIGVPCSGPAKHVVVQFTQKDRVVGTARTDAEGRYRVVLPAGGYAVHVARRFGVSIKPRSTIVRAATMRRLDLRIDTGIR